MTQAESLQKFNDVYKTVQEWATLADANARQETLSRPESVRILTGIAVDRYNPIWSDKSWLYTRTPQIQNLSRAMMKAAEKLLADPSEEVLPLLATMETFVEHLNKVLADNAIPTKTKFQYQGFAILNPEGLPDSLIRHYLDGVDYLVKLFERRGVSEVLREGLKAVELSLPEDTGAHGRYLSHERKIRIQPGFSAATRMAKTWVAEVFIHEFGHHLHMNFLHPRAREFWDSGWEDVEKARKELEGRFAVTHAERLKFFDLIKANGWNPQRAGAKLKGIPRMKFLAWLHKTQGSPVSSSPNQVRLTPYGKALFEFLADPEEYARENVGSDPVPYIARMTKAKLSTLGLTEYYQGTNTPMLDAETVESIRKEDTSVDAALNALGIPSTYGRTDVYEDFAETFVLFMEAPEKLSDTARYRMQRALSLSGLYGRDVMKLSHRIASRWLHQAP